MAISARPWQAVKKLNLPAGGLRSPAQKLYILHKKLSLSRALCAKPLPREHSRPSIQLRR